MTNAFDSEWGEPAAATRWQNWGRNQGFAVAQIATPADEAEVIAAVQQAVAKGHTVRAAGSGHSFTPIVETRDLLLDLRHLSGVVAADADTRRAIILAGTRMADVGAPLWKAGLALANQGDTDIQTMSGAIATGTKGSGPAFGNMSSMLRSVRIINGVGDVVDVFEHDLNLLHAAQVSIGLLGVMTRLELEVVPRYRLAEENRIMPFAEVAEKWDEFLSGYRHFSFWWCPFEGSSAMYDLGDVPPDHCAVKLLREARPDEPTVSEPAGSRADRSYLIYPDGTTEAEFHELEYMVPATSARDAVELMRDLQLHRFTEEISPLQIRWQKGDQAYLSPQYGRDSVSVSVSGVIGKNYEPFLRAVDRELQVFDARPHWGKLHYLTPDRVRALYPRFDDFQAMRREFDPAGLFLNDHLQELFAD